MKKQLYKSLAFAALLCLTLSMQSCTDKEETDVYASTKIDFSVTVTPSKVDLPARNASQEIQVTANTAWGVSSDVTWAHVSASSGTANGSFTITLDDNPSLEARQATIVVKYGSEGKETITVHQNASNPTSFSKAEITGITRHEAKASGSFSSPFDVQEYGIVYSATVKEPTLNADDRNILSIKVGTAPISQGDISTTISNLKSATTYYLRFYTRGPLGTEYSTVTTFKTEGQTPSEGDHTTPEI